ncbi:MAG: hypothetical protein Ct9H300mP16_09930 [Pseudomonadota bacterium]|nr:MAG: hypothetical protein Ct9H300mP16_09930 [Pseudomonadota bacterium]
MGQGAHTGQAMLLAEQLEADWDTIEVVTAPVGSEYGNKKFLNHQVTGGSSSVTAWWDELSEVGAPDPRNVGQGGRAAMAGAGIGV